MNRNRRALCAATAVLPWAAPALAETGWPKRPVRIVVPFPPGGGTDIIARALAGALAERLGQPVAVENKPGAATLIGADSVAKSDPDGHVLLISGSTTFTVNPALRRKLPYDPARDLIPLAMLARAPLVLVVRADAPWKTLPDLVSAARAAPGRIAYATYGPGSGPQLAATLLALEADVRWLEVAYKGGAPAMTDLLGGQIQFVIDTVASAGPQIRAGKLRALAVLDRARTPVLPDVPSLADARMPGAAFDAWYALAVPGRMPTDARVGLERALRATLADPSVQSVIRAQSMEPAFVAGDALRSLVDDETARYRMVGHRAGIALD